MILFQQVAFSYLYEKVVGFTRDYDSIKNALNKVEVYSKTCIETALNGVRAIVTEEWSNTTCQVSQSGRAVHIQSQIYPIWCQSDILAPLINYRIDVRMLSLNLTSNPVFHQYYWLQGKVFNLGYLDSFFVYNLLRPAELGL